MPEYQFEIQGCTKIIVEAENAEKARMVIIANPLLYEGEIMSDCCISDGEEVKR